MTITEIRVEQCGVLRRMQLTGLSGGLNVVQAPDEAGTALVGFLRRMLFGLDVGQPASRKESGRLGSVTIDHGGVSYRLVRSDRAGHPETFAICSCGNEPTATDALRATLATADRRLIEQVCLVTPESWDRPEELRELVELPWQAPFAPPNARRAESRPGRGAVASLAQRCELLRLEVSTRARSEARKQQEFEAQIRRIDDQARGIDERMSWLDAELQAAVSDVRDVEDRLWSPPVEPHAADRRSPHGAMNQTRGYAEHLRLVICDLAERRLKLSRLLTKETTRVDVAFPGERSHTIRVENERLRIDRCEAELLHQLRCLEHAPADEFESAVASKPCPRREARDEDRLRDRLEPLQTRCRELRRELETARGRQCELQTERRQLDIERRHRAADGAIDGHLYELSVLEQQLVSAEEEQQATVLLDRARQRLQCPQETAAFIEQRASALLMWLTGETPHGGADTPAAAGNGADERRRALWPCDGGREPGTLALRLALLSAAARGGSELPAVWGDALTASDLEKMCAAGRVLVEFAKQGIQIILVTGRDEVARRLAECGAAVHQPAWTDAPTQESKGPIPQIPDVSEADPTTAPLVRIHPAEPHWLRADSSLSELPSLGPQMARQLRRMGLVDIGDLIALDVLKCPFLLSESRLTAEQVRLWQAEAELLCCVPDLTGRDAQLLVSCGLLTPGELAAANADGLALRIDRLRGGDSTRWLPYVGVWPRAETVRSWIHAARRARSLPAVFAAADVAGRPPRRWPSRIEREAARVIGMSADGEPALERPASPDVRLRPDSPVIDAPAIGPKTARLLERIGILTVGNLLACDATATALRLRHPRITADVLVTWQRQSALMCSIPGLRCGDAQVLVACGIHQAADLRRISASALSAIVEPYVGSEEGRRLLRSAAAPTADDVARWVESAQNEGVSRAA